MAICALDGVRKIGMADLFAAAPEPAREQLCQYENAEGDAIVVHSNALTLVLNRDIRESVEISNAMSLFLARKFPERHVLLINTYAGADLMQRTFAHALHEQNIPLPPSFARFFEEHDHVTFDDAVPNPFPENLSILDAPTSLLTASRLEEEVKERPGCIVLLNSFEFTSFSRWEREQFAQGILAIRARMPLTMVIFSHEQRYDVASFTPARGPIGALSAYAASVWRLMSHEEKLRWEKRYSVYALHSQKMHNPNPPLHENETQLRERTPIEARAERERNETEERARVESFERAEAKTLLEELEWEEGVRRLRTDPFDAFSGKTEYADGWTPRKKEEV